MNYVWAIYREELEDQKKFDWSINMFRLKTLATKADSGTLFMKGSASIDHLQMEDLLLTS